MSLEIDNVAEAEPVISVEGNMCGTVMRGAVAPPGSKATSRRKGMRRNLRDLTRACCTDRAVGMQGWLA